MRKFKLIAKKNDEIILSDQDIYHLKKVLRAKKDQQIICYDKDFEYDCQIFNLTPFCLKILSNKKIEKNDCYPINFFVGVIKKANFETLVKNLNELNVNSITPVYFERSQTNNKLNYERLNLILENSCKQCERKIPLILNPAINFIQLQKLKLDGINIVASLDNNGDTKIPNCDKKAYNVFIGPEGGFTSMELNWFKENSFSIRFNKLILRTETASSTLAAILIAKISNLF